MDLINRFETTRFNSDIYGGRASRNDGIGNHRRTRYIRRDIRYFQCHQPGAGNYIKTISENRVVLRYCCWELIALFNTVWTVIHGGEAAVDDRLPTSNLSRQPEADCWQGVSIVDYDCRYRLPCHIVGNPHNCLKCCFWDQKHLPKTKMDHGLCIKSSRYWMVTYARPSSPITQRDICIITGICPPS